MNNRAGISLVAALFLIIPTVALVGVAGLDDPTGVLSANDNQVGEDDDAEVLQEEATPAASPEADDSDDAEQDSPETPGASPEADDDEDAAEDQDEAGDVDDNDDGEDADEAEDEDGDVEDADEAGDVDDADEAEDDDGGAGAGTPPPGS